VSRLLESLLTHAERMLYGAILMVAAATEDAGDHDPLASALTLPDWDGAG
jgi:hypothetical protein